MPGPMKQNYTRTARRNKSATRAMLTEPDKGSIKIPDLPPIRKDWHPMAVRFWTDGWSSPLAAQWIRVDIHGLYRYVDLVHRYWIAEKSTEKLALSAELRLLGQLYGTSPQDRNRLEWQIVTTEKAQDDQQRRRATQTVLPSAPKMNADNDPRLRLVE